MNIVKEITLKNFKNFEEVNLKFTKRCTILIGNNGTGKSTIIDAISQVLWQTLSGIKEVPTPSYSFKTYVRQGFEAVDGKLSPKFADFVKYEVRVEIFGHKDKLFGGSEDLRYSFDHSRNYEEIHQEIVNENKILPLLRSFSVNAPIVEKNHFPPLENRAVSLGHSRFLGYTGCLSSQIRLGELYEFLKTENPEKFFQIFKLFAEKLIPEFRDIQWEPEKGDNWLKYAVEELYFLMEIDGSKQYIPFPYVSSGYRRILTICLDIVYRIYRLNPELDLEEYLLVSGFVCIDEVDLHLHPRWQKQIISRLLNAFPHLQFIVTTHSPFIIQSLFKNDDTALISLNNYKSLLVETQSIEDIAELYQDVENVQRSNTFLEMEELATEYYLLLTQMKTAKKERIAKIRTKLDLLELPFNNDPAFTAFIKMERMAAEHDLQDENE